MEKEPRQFKIRQATSGDAEVARRLQAESWLATYPSEDNGVTYKWVKEWTDSWFTPEKLEESKVIFSEVVADTQQFYRLAVSGSGAVIGFVHAKSNDDGTKELAALYTLPRTFGTGVGQALMDCANSWLGVSETTLEVASYNARAIRFYEKYGFVTVPDSEYLYRSVIPVVKMMKRGESDEV